MKRNLHFKCYFRCDLYIIINTLTFIGGHWWSEISHFQVTMGFIGNQQQIDLTVSYGLGLSSRLSDFCYFTSLIFVILNLNRTFFCVDFRMAFYMVL